MKRHIIWTPECKKPYNFASPFFEYSTNLCWVKLHFTLNRSGLFTEYRNLIMYWFISAIGSNANCSRCTNIATARNRLQDNHNPAPSGSPNIGELTGSTAADPGTDPVAADATTHDHRHPITGRAPILATAPDQNPRQPCNDDDAEPCPAVHCHGPHPDEFRE